MRFSLGYFTYELVSLSFLLISSFFFAVIGREVQDNERMALRWCGSLGSLSLPLQIDMLGVVNNTEAIQSTC